MSKQNNRVFLLVLKTGGHGLIPDGPLHNRWGIKTKTLMTLDYVVYSAASEIYDTCIVTPGTSQKVPKDVIY